MLTANTALCVRVSSEKHPSAGSRCWKCLTGWPRKKKMKGRSFAVSWIFVLRGFIMSMRIPLTHSNEVTRFSSCMLKLPATLQLLSPPPLLLAPNRILLLQPGASVSNGFCALLRLLSWAHFHTVPPEKQDASHGVRVERILGRPSLFHGFWSDQAKKCAGGLCRLLHSDFLFGEILIGAALKWFRSGHPTGLSSQWVGHNFTLV